ncbi:kinase-like domain-containing protein [Hypoxylon sp. FL1857]|nr:kinase-like domain-containing protein [Hypoxylon sp. FL1857]
MALGIDGCISNLREQIQDSLVTSISEHLFLPTDKLHEILTLSAVQDAVKQLKCGPDDRIKLADTIYREGRRVFAMLIYNYWEDLIVEFRKHGALDRRLPLSEAYAETIVNRDIARRIARDAQWGFCPYTFPVNMSESHYQTEKKMILPFISTEQIGPGAFSDVYKMTISPSQQNFDKATMAQVVRKQLREKGKTEEFEREIRCLRLLSRLQHPNIIPLWGSYTYRDEQNFLFPYIGMDLGSFLIAETRYQDFQWDVTFYSALTGLASALSKTHHLLLNQADHDVDFEAIGYHHDLRPPNVLVRPDTFILADFGLEMLRQAGDSSHTPYKWISGDYVAPETTDGQENPQTANRATDVWAFGCLVAEVVTYMLTGAEGVKEFRTKRLTWGRLPNWKDANFYQPNGDVKQEVIDWMEALKRDNLHPDLVPLLVDLALDALQPNPQERPGMNTIYERLSFLSVQKHIHAVQTEFRGIQGAGERAAPLSKHHQKSLLYAQERFEVWGNILDPGENSAPALVEKHLWDSVDIMKKILQALREEPEIQHLGDGSALLSLENLIVQSVEDLWALLPNSLLQSAKNQWQEKVSDNGVIQQMQSPCRVDDGGLPAACMDDATDSFKSEFKEEARKLKDILSDPVLLDEILEVTSMNDVYDIIEKIQAERHKHGRLRDLPTVRRYLDRLKGYVDDFDRDVF